MHLFLYHDCFPSYLLCNSPSCSRNLFIINWILQASDAKYGLRDLGWSLKLSNNLGTMVSNLFLSQEVRKALLTHLKKNHCQYEKNIVYFFLTFFTSACLQLLEDLFNCFPSRVTKIPNSVKKSVNSKTLSTNNYIF